MLEHIQKSAEEVAARVVAHRRTLHQIPEVGLELPQTADYVRKVLTELGYRPENIGISGVVATLGPGGAHPAAPGRYGRAPGRGVQHPSLPLHQREYARLRPRHAYGDSAGGGRGAQAA